ncbi:asparaginase [Pseudonocardia petroleophila]|uniref:Asparaginase n=1 Tax=Pseudonocardia petroleophila TaxID=37331 RepID=A0A7G7MR48_9PSEU|nr:asparaginase [Pseudonocardia petroleophila]
MDDRAQALAHVVRGGTVESVHRGHLVALDGGGSPVLHRGDPDVTVFARSTLKPVQAVAMLRAGLDLDGELLALACSSHSGEPIHVDGVRRILAGAGRTEDDLANTPAYPLGEDVGATWRADGFGPSSLVQNCSGKHAAMIATCVAAGWPVEGYRAPDHPLQESVRETVQELTGDAAEHVTVDGCGAPLYSCTLTGLAHAFARLVLAEPGSAEHRVAAAMSAHPEWVGGIGRDVSAFLSEVPGLVAKDGAEGVWAAALPDGGAVAVKVLDGAMRPLPVVVAGALRALGADVPDDLGRRPVLGGGEPVGEIRAVLA